MVIHFLVCARREQRLTFMFKGFFILYLFYCSLLQRETPTFERDIQRKRHNDVHSQAVPDIPARREQYRPERYHFCAQYGCAGKKMNVL